MPFKRKYKLTISKPPETNKDKKTITPEEGSVKVVTTSNDLRTIDSINAVEITELQIAGSISSSKEKSASGCKLDIQGLSDETLAYIKNGSIVILEMGYEDDPYLPVVFSGQAKSASVDTETEVPKVSLDCVDGYTPSSSVKISKYYPPNTSYLDILEDLASIYADNGIPLGRPLSELQSLQGVGVDAPADSIIFTDGFSNKGFLDTCLRRICEDIGFTHYISNSRLYIEPKNYQQFTKLYTIPPSNVLSAKQSVTGNVDKTAADNQESKETWKIKVLLDGRLEVGNFIELKIDDVVEGRFKIITTSIDFDYEGDIWFTTMEVQNA